MNRISERMLALGTARSEIRELFEYGKTRIAAVGADNVFDFSLGNPSVEPPACVSAEALRLLREENAVFLHGLHQRARGTREPAPPWLEI